MSAAAPVAGEPQFQDVALGETLVTVKNLKKYFPVTEGMVFNRTVAHVKAVDDVSFSIKRGETLAKLAVIAIGGDGCHDRYCK